MSSSSQQRDSARNTNTYRTGAQTTTGTKAKSTLREKMLERVVNAHNSAEQFIPISDIHSVLTSQAITEELERNEIRDRAAIMHTISSKKLFAILLIIGRIDILPWMIESGLGDNSLPFTMHAYAEKEPHFLKFCSKHVAWDENAQRLFIDAQWMFMAPVFEEGKHRVFEDDIRLPFTDMNSLGSGSFGNVYRVSIHADHHNFESHDAQNTIKVAIKEFSQNTKEANSRTFKNELAMIKSMQAAGASNVLESFASYEHKNRFYLILPLARENLREFWANSQLRTPTWNLEGMAGVSSGLTALHRTAGFHLDLKPENILIFDDGSSPTGTWKIGDFGLSINHPEGPQSELPWHPGTGTYEPPECQLHLKQSQKYDLWSLGCIFLECIIWSLMGHEALDQFADDRLRDTPGSDQNFQNDYFFSLTAKESSTPLGAQIRPAVVRWIESLEKNANCSSEVFSTLLLIREGLLQIEQALRLDAAKVSEVLSDLAYQSGRVSEIKDSHVSHQASQESRITELDGTYEKANPD